MKRKYNFLSVVLVLAAVCVVAVSAYFYFTDFISYQISNPVTVEAEHKTYTQNNSDPLSKEGDFDAVAAKYKGVITAVEKGYKSFQRSIDLAKFSITKNELNNIVQYLSVCHGYYYVKSGYNYTTIGDRIKEYRPEYFWSANDVEKINIQIDEVLNSVAEQAASFKTDIEKLIYIHDYLVLNISYGEENNNIENNIYGALVLKNTVCTGYSEAFCQIASKAGIKSWVVTSSELNHAWNMVLLGGRYYFIDCTWDDPAITSPSLLNDPVSGYGNYRYFVCSEEYFYNNDHKSKDWVVNGTSVSGLAASKFYDDFFWRNYESLMKPSAGSWYHSYGYEAEDVKPDQVKFSIEKISFSNNENYTLNTERTVYTCWYMGNSYYPVFYSTLQSYNGAVYYMRSDGIYKLNGDADFNGSGDACVFKNPRNDNIYDFVIDENSQTFTVMYGKTMELNSSNAQQVSYNISDYNF